MLEMEIIEPNILEMELTGQIPSTTGGTTNYNDLFGKPKINGVELKGNLTTQDLKIEAENEVYVGTEEPTDEDVEVWINPDGEPVTIPTKVSQLENDKNFVTDDDLKGYAKTTDIPDVSKFITKDVSDLTNYYDKDDIDNLVGDIETLLGGI
jgi:hypothetical protein